MNGQTSWRLIVMRTLEGSCRRAHYNVEIIADSEQYIMKRHSRAISTPYRNYNLVESYKWSRVMGSKDKIPIKMMFTTRLLYVEFQVWNLILFSGSFNGCMHCACVQCAKDDNQWCYVAIQREYCISRDQKKVVKPSLEAYLWLIKILCPANLVIINVSITEPETEYWRDANRPPQIAVRTKFTDSLIWPREQANMQISHWSEASIRFSSRQQYVFRSAPICVLTAIAVYVLHWVLPHL